MPEPPKDRYWATDDAKSANIAMASPEIESQPTRVMCRLVWIGLLALPVALITGASRVAHSPVSVPLTIGLLADPEIVAVSPRLSTVWTLTEPGSPTWERPNPDNVIVPVTCFPPETTFTSPVSTSVPLTLQLDVGVGLGLGVLGTWCDTTNVVVPVTAVILSRYSVASSIYAVKMGLSTGATIAGTFPVM